MATTNSVKESIDKISHEFDWLRGILIDFNVSLYGNIDTREMDRQIIEVTKSIENAKDEIDDLSLELEEINETIQELDSKIKGVESCD